MNRYLYREHRACAVLYRGIVRRGARKRHVAKFNVISCHVTSSHMLEVVRKGAILEKILNQELKLLRTHQTSWRKWTL